MSNIGNASCTCLFSRIRNRYEFNNEQILKKTTTKVQIFDLNHVFFRFYKKKCRKPP